MINFLKGKVVQKGDKFIVLEIANIGFQIFCAPERVKEFPLNREVKVFTKLLFAREEPELYGFASQAELELFELLNNISGIGTKTALSLSSFGSLENLKKALESGKPLEGVKGLGQKRLQRINLEITGKIKEVRQKKDKAKIPKRDEVLEGLEALGFSRQEAKAALSQISPNIKEPKERIKAALKILGR